MRLERIVYAAQGHRHRPADGDAGRHRQAARRRRRAARLLALVDRPSPSSALTMPGPDAGASARRSPPPAFPSSARSASWRSPAGGRASHRRRLLRRLQQRLWPVHGRARSGLTTSLNAGDRGGAAVRPYSSGVRGAPRGRAEPHRSRHARRTCRRAQPVVPLRRGRAVDARGHRVRGPPGREHRDRRRLGLGQVDPAAPAAGLRDCRRAAASTTTTTISRRSTSGWCAARSARVLGELPTRARQHLRQHRGQRPADPRAGRWKRSAWPASTHDIAAMPMGLDTIVIGRRRPALGRPAPARDDRPARWCASRG